MYDLQGTDTTGASQRSTERFKKILTTVKIQRPDEVNEIFSSYLIFSAALGLGIYSASNINEYQKQKSNVSGE
jgi:hypothetical protein